MQNPYNVTGFWSFFLVLLQRLIQLPTLIQTPANLASDEIQLIVLMTLGISCGALGVLLVWRRMTMLANSLSHTILLGIAAVFLLVKYGWVAGDAELGALPSVTLLIASAVTGLATAMLTQTITKVFRLPEETSTGLVFTSLFALGIVIITIFSRNAHVGLEVVMGNVDGLSLGDVYMSLYVLGCNLILLPLLHRPYLVTSFDGSYAQLLGFRTSLYGHLLMLQTAITVVAGFRAVGVLMVLCFITGPAIVARPFCRSLRSMLLSSAAIGALCSLLAVASSRAILTNFGVPLATGPIAVAWMVMLVLASLFVRVRTKNCTVYPIASQSHDYCKGSESNN